MLGQIYFWEESGATCLVVQGLYMLCVGVALRGVLALFWFCCRFTLSALLWVMPDGFTAMRLKWGPCGKKLIVLSRTSWTCGYLEA